MAAYQVQCVNIDQGSDYDDCRCIEGIGFNAKGGGITVKSPSTVYDWVENEGHTVYVKHEGERTDVHGSTHNGTKYVRTEPNDTEDDNLLSQDSCP